MSGRINSRFNLIVAVAAMGLLPSVVSAEAIDSARLNELQTRATAEVVGAKALSALALDQLAKQPQTRPNIGS